jgi:molecular chaperone HtpG
METFTLKAETGRLLDLVIHSLYTKREIFLRELVSNASDALDRFRLESMLRPELLDDTPLEIRLEVDITARTLTVRDTGIGMTREEVIEQIGTIARSGTSEFQARMNANPGQAQAVDLIGRFGVGFYSCFMVADRVTLITRRGGEPVATRWESAGDVNYTVADAPDAPRGTSVTLHLKPVSAEDEIEDYTSRGVLSRIVKRYADFLTYPIFYVGQPDTVSHPPAAGVVSEPVLLNSRKPIWRRPAGEVKPEEYDEFYKHISHGWEEPLLRMSFKAEGRWEYAALVFVPRHAPHDLYYHATPFGLQLYSQRMLIIENCQELLPRYLRFLKGIVDATDLPLNVSRQSLQDAHHLTSIRRWLSRKVIDTFAKLRENDAEKYTTLWKEFGRALKEGVSEDSEQRERLLPLLLFESSLDETKLTSLADYVSRMKPEQKEIFYLAGELRRVIERSPHLEELRNRGYEVLYLTEAVDELVTQAVHEFQGHRFRSAAKGTLDLGAEAERDQAEQEVKAQTERFGALLQWMTTYLESHVSAVQISKRLKTSPACLTGGEFDMSPHIERILRGKAQLRRRTLELNPQHPIVTRLYERFTADVTDPLVPKTADLLVGMVLLAEGSELHDPVEFTTNVANLLERALEPRDASAFGSR